jgi:hypothetical protein
MVVHKLLYSIQYGNEGTSLSFTDATIVSLRTSFFYHTSGIHSPIGNSNIRVYTRYFVRKVAYTMYDCGLVGGYRHFGGKKPAASIVRVAVCRLRNCHYIYTFGCSSYGRVRLYVNVFGLHALHGCTR